MLYRCSKCGEYKEKNLFGKSTKAKTGLQSWCKACHARKQQIYTKKHPDKFKALRQTDKYKEYQNKYRKENKEKIRQAQEKYRKGNRKKCSDANQQWREKNRALINEKFCELRKSPSHKIYMTAKCREYQAKKRNAMPRWANKFIIQEAYHLAKLREVATGIKWHVDHIVPLQSKVVCGFHVENNLQVIPAKMNLQKHNRHWPDMP